MRQEAELFRRFAPRSDTSVTEKVLPRSRRLQPDLAHNLVERRFNPPVVTLLDQPDLH